MDASALDHGFGDRRELLLVSRLAHARTPCLGPSGSYLAAGNEAQKRASSVALILVEPLSLTETRVPAFSSS